MRDHHGIAVIYERNYVAYLIFVALLDDDKVAFLYRARHTVGDDYERSRTEKRRHRRLIDELIDGKYRNDKEQECDNGKPKPCEHPAHRLFDFGFLFGVGVDGFCALGSYALASALGSGVGRLHGDGRVFL